MKKRVITGVDVPPTVEAAEIGIDKSLLPDPIQPAEIGDLADIGIDKSLLPDPIQPAEIGDL